MDGQSDGGDSRHAEPGWYPDPHEENRLRRWDGRRWTDSWMAAPGGTTTATVPNRRPTEEGWYADPRPGEGGPRERFWDGVAWTRRLRHGRTFPGRPPLAGWFTGVALTLRVALLLGAVGAAATLGMALWTLSLTDQALNGSGYGIGEANAFDTLDLVVSLVVAVVALLTIPLFLTWLSAAYRNDRVDPSRLTHSRGWAVGAWFVPFMNLVRPYRIVADLRQGIRSGLGDDRPDPYPRSVGWWWAAWLVMNVSSTVSQNVYLRMIRLDDDTEYLEMWRISGWAEIVASLATAVAAWLAYTLVTRITAGLRRPEFTDRSEDLPER